MAITPLPTPPSRDDPANFATRADAFLGALPDFATEANALAAAVNDDASTAAAQAGISTTQAGIATAQAGISTTQAGISTTQAGIATAQAVAAAASAASAAAMAGAFVGTSTSSVTIGLGNKTFSTQTGEQYTSGIWMTVVSAANAANFMFGQVVSYSGSSLIVNVQSMGGSGTHADWNLSLAGVRGAPGTGITDQATGFTATGGTTPKTLTVDIDLQASKAIQVESAGTSGQVLTSAGPGVAPTWSTPSAGGTVTGTASGSISSGSPVLVNTNGTFSAPTVTVGPASLGSQSSGVSTGGSATYSMVYCASPGVYVLFYTSSSTYYLCGRIGTPSSDGSISWSSEFVLGSSQVWEHVSAVYLSSDPGKCAVFVTGGGGAAGLIYAVSVTASSLTSGSPASTGRSDNYGGIAWNSTNQIGMVCGVDGNTGYMFNCAFTISGTTVTAGSPVSSVNGYEPNIEYDKNSGYFLTACRANSNTICIMPATTTSGRVVTQYTMTTVASVGNTASGNYGMVYVPGPNKVLVMGSQNYNTSVYVFITMTGSTPSAASTYADTSVTYSGQHRALGLDSVNGAVASNYRNSSGYPEAKSFQINGTTISLSSAVQLATENNAVCGRSGKIAFDILNARLASYYGGSTVYAKTFKAAASTLTPSNFVGFSEASYTNGQSATVAVVGGKSTTVSGVSVGVKNYVGGASLTTTDTGIYAGIGLSETSILVKG